MYIAKEATLVGLSRTDSKEGLIIPKYNPERACVIIIADLLRAEDLKEIKLSVRAYVLTSLALRVRELSPIP